MPMKLTGVRFVHHVRDRGGRILGKPFEQPFSDAPTGPVFARARWWNHLGTIVEWIPVKCCVTQREQLFSV
jgi:hypothetical protein